MKTAPCKECQATWHTKSYHKPKVYNSLQSTKRPLTIKKPLRQRGKVANEWTKTRREWVKQNPPNHAGYYLCHICRGMVAATEMELDHVLSRSRRPDLRYELSNLKPSHHTCNSVKGST